MFPRVTHPSATDVLLRPFDLHVLSLPPAFVLSQDQTLKFNLMLDQASQIPNQPKPAQDPRHLQTFRIPSHKHLATSIPSHSHKTAKSNNRKTEQKPHPDAYDNDSLVQPPP